MKIKYWLKYLIFITVILFLIFLREYVEKMFTVSYYKYQANGILYAVISLFLGVLIGMFLGLEHLLSERGKGGTWKVHLPKLILIGLPSLYFSLANLWIISGNQFLLEIIAYPLFYFMRYGSGYVSLFQIILGYAVITSFFKYRDMN